MAAAASVAVGYPTPGRTGTRSLRVLVVDDDPDSRHLLEEAVERLGHRSTTACDGLEALAMQQAEPADVILSDWDMAGMTGIELCRRVRAQESVEYTYFAFMTGFDDRAHLLEGLRAGADDYLTKPVDLEELEVRLLSAVRVLNHERGLAQMNAALREESHLSFEEARVDPLTQIANRLRLREDLDALQAQAARYGHRYCAALCDIDWFKGYNDTCGHLAGDEALRRVAATIRDALRQGDTLYRYGGEEFLVILSEQGISDARQAMDRVRGKVAALGVPHPGSPAGVVTISVGIAEIGDTGVSNDDWLRRADAALYRAKQNGRNRVEIAPNVPVAEPPGRSAPFRPSGIRH